MKRIIVFFGRLFSFIIPSGIYIKISNSAGYFRAGYYKKLFKSLGKDAVFGKNVTVIGGGHISIGEKVVIQSDVILSTWGKAKKSLLVLNDGVHIGKGCHITAANSIVLGKGTLLGKYVTITDNSHGAILGEELTLPPYKRSVYSKGPIIIGDNVWIGDKVSVLPNVTIGDSAIIGANSVVTKSIPEKCIAVGNPAIVIKQM